MSEVSPTPDPARGPARQTLARSFGPVADAYDRARPSYPRSAVDWMVGDARARVLELGAGTGKLTEVVHDAGHEVLATDPSPQMLRTLAARVPALHAVARAEGLPVASASVDVVLSGQAFHWFDHEPALAEMGRVLRPGGVVALAWNVYDTSVPWVRRLSRLVAPWWATQEHGPERPLLLTPYFGFVEHREFRVWARHTRASLLDLARSNSRIATLPEDERAEVLAQVGALYDDYGRGPDGMQLPYLTRCFRAVVIREELPPEVAPADPRGPGSGDDAPLDPGDTGRGQRHDAPPEDPGLSLIDFR